MHFLSAARQGEIVGESRIPWWLIVLLVITFASLAVWQSSRWTIQMRWRTGAIALIYFVLLAIAFGIDPQGSFHQTTSPPGRSTADTLMSISGGVGIFAAVALLGRPALVGQLAWYALLSMGNALFCASVGQRDMGISLLAVGVISTIAAITKQRHLKTHLLTELLPRAGSQVEDEAIFAPWLTGATGVLLALVLVGTIYYVAHNEMTRTTTSHKRSAMPTRERIRSVLSAESKADTSASVFELALGRRADIVVLVFVMAIISVASIMSDARSTITPDAEADSVESIHK